jgi:collagenase-like PrtC family protease
VQPTQQKPELLAPAGGVAQLEAAIHAGADAVYFGLNRGLNARARAEGIPWQSLQTVMEQLHKAGRKGYLVLNTLVFDEELPLAETHIRHAANCGVDALIVQDLGLIHLAQATAPQLPLHGSTQMSITDAAGVAFAQSLGIQRVVLGRELSIQELATVQAANTDIEIEAFIHGALCVSYSGQCFSSEAWGGRSANRGQCAQACRLPYGLLVDGQLKQLGDFNYLLSPQDLMGMQHLPALIKAGIHSFKIEGRLKGPQYVATTVAAYRRAIDETWEAVNENKADDEYCVDLATRRQLAQLFSRGQDAQHDGLSPGFLLGSQHQSLVIGRNPRHRGLHLGQVEKIFPHAVTLRLHNPVKAGDGVVFDAGNPQAKEMGGNIFSIEAGQKKLSGEIAEGLVQLNFGRTFRSQSIHIGDHVWRTRDAATDGGISLRPTERLNRLALNINVTGELNKPLQIQLSTAQGLVVNCQSSEPLQAAQQKMLDENSIKKAIGRLGDTGFYIADLHIQIATGLFLPIAQIKQLRRDAITALEEKLIQHQRNANMPNTAILPQLTASPPIPQAIKTPQIALLCRSAQQVDAAITLPSVTQIILDFLEIQGLKQACEKVKNAGKKLVIAAPRIFKPTEERLLKYLINLSPDALLVRSTGLLQQLKTTVSEKQSRFELWGDFSLNASNQLAAQTLLNFEINRLAPTHDLNAAQIATLAKSLPPAQREKLEVIMHHHLPIFHTEHCVFARFLSNGNSYKDCGRPCESQRVHLRDSKAKDHLLQADIGCRNTLFNAEAQSAAPMLRDLLAAGIQHYRIELVDEPAEYVETIVNGYLAVLKQECSPQALWQTLSKIPDANGQPQGVAAGSFAIRQELQQQQMKKPTAR